jgi:hypothetical protein
MPLVVRNDYQKMAESFYEPFSKQRKLFCLSIGLKRE